MRILLAFLIFAILGCNAWAISIDAVYFAQTHVQKPDQAYFRLVGGRPALLKVHVSNPSQGAAPAVTAALSLNGQALNITLAGPSTLPSSIQDGPGIVQHTYANSFTATIPAQWVKPGLDVTVTAGATSVTIDNVKVGAPTRVLLNMFDIHFFKYQSGDYPAGWQEEIEAKWPVVDLDVRRLEGVVFPEVVIPPRAGAPAVRVTSTTDYKSQTGVNFDGEQDTAASWNSALKRAAGRSGRVSLYYTNIHGVAAGGQAGGFAGVGNGKQVGILHHELGHALSLRHWGDNGAYPYKGAMFGIAPPSNYKETHAGPTWAYDLRTGNFISPTVQPGNAGGKPVGTFTIDPMQGGGTGYQVPPLLLNHFSDYSVDKMRVYLEGHVVVWNSSLGSYASWDQATAGYTKKVSNNGVQFPIERDVDVISLLVVVSGPTPSVSMVYPPIGPYKSGLIQLFDPRIPEDRVEAAAKYAPAGGCDVCLRIVQGGVEKIYLLALPVDPASDPLSASSLKTEALNLPASDGEITRVDLLLTPDAQVNGLPSNPVVLFSRDLTTSLPDVAVGASRFELRGEGIYGSAASQQFVLRTRRGKSVKAVALVANRGPVADVIQLRATRSGNQWKVVYTDGTNITSNLFAGTYRTPPLDLTTADRIITAKFAPSRRLSGARMKPRTRSILVSNFTARSNLQPTLSDSARLRMISR